jgi:predicted metal-dependent enzyme (double-stranded beta helix superfamily)
MTNVNELIRRLDAAVRAGSVPDITSRIKGELESLTRGEGLDLPPRFREPQGEHYARRLLHRDPKTGYTAVIMAWAPGQRTALHDHAGIWCVEGVVEGQMEVTRFDLVREANGAYEFAEKGSVRAAVGSAGALIPPFEYHVLANALGDRPSITLHVYGGEMDHCHIFQARSDGKYDRLERTLSYDD